MPRTQNWSTGIQWQPAHDTVLEVDYVGLHGTRQNADLLSNINQVNPQYLSLGSLLTQSVTSSAAIAAGIQIPYPGFTGTVAQASSKTIDLRTARIIQLVDFLAGANGEGTEAAGHLVTGPDRLANAMRRCGIYVGGPLRHFEILLRLSTMAGSPTNVDVVACHTLSSTG